LRLTDIDNLKQYLSNSNWEGFFLSNSPTKNIDEWLCHFYRTIEEHTHRTKCRVRNTDKPWYRNNLKHLINTRHRLFSKAKLRNRAEDWFKYHEAARLCVEGITKAKDDYFNSLVDSLSEHSTASKRWWQVTKEITGGKKGSINIPPLLNEADQIVSETTQKCNLLNSFFTKQSNIDDVGINPPEPQIRTQAILDNIIIEAEEVRKVISGLNVSKANGQDGISNKFIMLLCESLSEPLTEFFNYSLRNGIFPTKWKSANVVPIFKKGDNTLPTNYRPVSLLNCLSKVFEKVVANRLITYILDNKLVSPNQSGFMPKDSTTNQLVKIVDYVLQGFDHGNDSIAVFLDISKAFDRVWHKGLIIKLYNNGIRGSLLNWFQSYVTGRSQNVVINGCSSDPLPVMAGVPQGSVLGPLLFLLYIDDVTDGLTCMNNLFADDTSLVERVVNFAESVSRVNNDLRFIEQWAAKWLVSFNPFKTVFVFFTLKNEHGPRPILYFCNKQITESPSHTHLGLTLTNNLDWSVHIDNILSKASKRMFILRSLSRKLPRKTLQIMYNSMIRSVLEYGCVVFGELPSLPSDKLERMQYRAGLAVSGAIRNTSYEKIRSELGWFTLEERRRYLQLILVYKIVNGLSPVYLQSILLPELPNLQYRLNLRNAANFYVRRCRLSKFQKSFGIAGVRNWNQLPIVLRNKPSIESFKINYKNQFFPTSRPEFNYGDRTTGINLTRFRLSYTVLNHDLASRGIIDSPVCLKCTREPETYVHYFFQCNKYVTQRRTLLLHLRTLFYT
jgi:hypothetical protein